MFLSILLFLTATSRVTQDCSGTPTKTEYLVELGIYELRDPQTLYEL